MDVPTIEAGIVTLRPWRAADAPWYVGARDEAVFRWTREPEAMAPAACAAQIMRTLGSAEHGSFAVEDSATGRPAGNVGMTVRAHSVELSYWITATARGHGFAAAALSAAANWAEETFDRPVLELQTHPDNVASQSVALRAGFVARGRRIARDDCADADGMVAHFERVKGPGGGDGSLGEAGRG